MPLRLLEPLKLLLPREPLSMLLWRICELRPSIERVGSLRSMPLLLPRSIELFLRSIMSLLRSMPLLPPALPRSMEPRPMRPLSPVTRVEL
jgi:hypothetical protein